MIGGLFVVSGFEKLIGPYQNFFYVIQNYSFLPLFLTEIAARLLPWFEFFLGIFLVLGLWTKWTLRAVMALLLMFMGVVIQALIRQLPITECGCFGGLILFRICLQVLRACLKRMHDKIFQVFFLRRQNS